MATTESLIIELDAKTSKLDARLKRTEKQLDSLNESTKKVDKSLLSLTDIAKKTAKGLAVMATAAIAVNAAISAMVLNSANNRRELEIMARQAKLSTEEFQALASATKLYGINAEQIADISKDVADRIGEFSAAGTGTFQDYADVIKLTKEEARKVAIEFQSLSGKEVIGRMVSEMEKAGVTGDKMTFVLESMGNDLSRLAPLFADNSKELKILEARFEKLNGSLQITDFQAEELKKVAQTYGDMTTQIGNATTAISASLAPVMDDFFNDVINIVPQATQTIIDFVNSFLPADAISKKKDALKLIADSQSRMFELNELLIKQEARVLEGKKSQFDVSGILLRDTKKRIEAEKLITEQLNAQIKVIEERERIADAKKLKGGEIGGLTGAASLGGGIGTGDEKQAIIDRFKDEEQLLFEKLDRELLVIGDNKKIIEALHDEHLMNIVALDMADDERKLEAIEKLEKEKAKIKEKANKEILKAEAKKAKVEAKIEAQKVSFANRTAQTLLSSTLTTQEKLFSIVKDSAASAIEAHGLTSAAKALAEMGPIAGAAPAAAVIGWSQVAAGIVRSLPLGGGGGASAGSPGGGASTPEIAQQSFQQEEFSQDTDITVIGDGSSSALSESFTFQNEGGSSADEVLTEFINDAIKSGRLTMGRT